IRTRMGEQHDPGRPALGELVGGGSQSRPVQRAVPGRVHQFESEDAAGHLGIHSAVPPFGRRTSRPTYRRAVVYVGLPCGLVGCMASGGYSVTGSTGSETVTIRPPPSRGVAVASPPWARATARTIDNPNPAPRSAPARSPPTRSPAIRSPPRR